MAKAENKKKNGKGGAVAAGAAALLLLLGGGRLALGGGDGLLPFGSGDAGEQSSTPPAVQEEPVQQSGETQTDNKLSIVVRQDAITVNGQETPADELEGVLTAAYADGVTVELKDDQAIKATYDEVVSTLERLDIPYTAAEG